MAWRYHQQITGIWTNNQNVNVWVWVINVGWRKLTNPDDDVTDAMLTMAANAKAHNWLVDFDEVSTGGNLEIREMYVW